MALSRVRDANDVELGVAPVHQMLACLGYLVARAEHMTQPFFLKWMDQWNDVARLITPFVKDPESVALYSFVEVAPAIGVKTSIQYIMDGEHGASLKRHIHAVGIIIHAAHRGSQSLNTPLLSQLSMVVSSALASHSVLAH